jgi:DNA-binding beta-propeller fold protein YncE
MTSSGSTLYVANYFSDNIEVFGVDAGGTLISKGTVGTGRCSIYPHLEPSGRFLYLANQRSNSVSLYTIDAATGVPTPVASYPSGAGTWGAQSDTAGKYLYVTNCDDDTLHRYIINQVTGALTPNAMASGATSMATVKVLVASHGEGVNHNIVKIDLSDNSVAAIPGTAADGECIVFSPDGSRIYVAAYVGIDGSPTMYRFSGMTAKN